MAVRTRSEGAAGVNWGSRAVSALAFAIAVVMTDRFIAVLAPEAGDTIIWAFFAQIIMTAGESSIWKGRGRWYNYLVLAIDTFTNIGGLFFYITNLDRTDSWSALNQGLGMTGGLNPLAALVISIAVGVLLAATPEFLWNQK